MGHMSAYAKAMNQQPKPHSKTQQEKKKKLLENPITKIGCKDCGITNTTLRLYDGNYYCPLCYPKTVVNDLVNEIKK